MSGLAIAIVIIVIILLIAGVYYYSTLPAPAPEPVTVTPIIASDGQKAVIVQPANTPATSVDVVPVVATPTVAAPPPAVAPPTVAAPPTGPKFIGCLKDSADRILPTQAPGGQLTWDSCKAAAGSAKYFGLQHWSGDPNRKTGECWYGNELKRQEPATNCIVEDGHHIGGFWSLAAYEAQ
jgi:hypothetical protein